MQGHIPTSDSSNTDFLRLLAIVAEFVDAEQMMTGISSSIRRLITVYVIVTRPRISWSHVKSRS